ncbi:Flp family type IVb pilin [Vibrio breoganii]
MTQLTSFIRNEDGLTVVSYVIGAALLVVVLIAVFEALEMGLSNSFLETMDEVNNK